MTYWDPQCRLAPFGWYCTRYNGHLGPCDAHPRWYTRLWRWFF